MFMTIVPELNPPPRLLMGPGPVGVDPRVLRAMSMPMLGQFDPAFTAYMNETMELTAPALSAPRTSGRCWSTAPRAPASRRSSCRSIAPGDKVLVPIFGRFGHLLAEIAQALRRRRRHHRARMGHGVHARRNRGRDQASTSRASLAVVHGDTSTTMAQPLAEIGAMCRKRDMILYSDATATLGGMPVNVDAWKLDAVSAGLQKCLSGPPGSSPITFNERCVEIAQHRKHLEAGIKPPGFVDGNGPRVQSNYFDLAMLMDYWSEIRLNHHTEATSMLYATREAVRIVLAEGLDVRFARHKLASDAITAGFTAMGLELFGDQKNKMPNVTGIHIPKGVDGDGARSMMLNDFGIEIGTSFGPLHGKIWRVGTMGYVCRKENVLICLAALEACLRRHGFKAPAGAGVDAALAVYDKAK